MKKTIGIMAALPQEVAHLLEAMKGQATSQEIAGRTFYRGQIKGQDCVVVLSRVGKVAAALTATVLIQEFKVQKIVFTGLAGSLDDSVTVGDVVVATQLAQYDLSASPLFKRYEIPLLGRTFIDCDMDDVYKLSSCSKEFIKWQLASHLSPDHPLLTTPPQVHLGLIASGDQFIHRPSQVEFIKDAFPDALCAEMEGAAVAQVGYEYGVPVAVFRIISDSANHQAPVHFSQFLEEVASFYGSGILGYYLVYL